MLNFFKTITIDEIKSYPFQLEIFVSKRLERVLIYDRDRVAMIDRETGGDTVIRYQLADYPDSSTIELDDKANIISYEEYHPFGTTSYRSGRTESELRNNRRTHI
ncbi:hypothetical protein [Vallitalea sp.]|uniref:hypothetical protein n=1 Tax=Vallitalea sp. TaxID=1882829 RepID=UPI0025F2C3E4|nr:hypothetical protein [Vallitalea sp.]MCT4686338.1 hypothetical protein [Vallitalea sp.]